MKIDRRSFMASAAAPILFMRAGSRQKEGTGSVVPDFTLPDLNGKNVRLEEYNQRIVLLDFWATWCEPCIEQIPQLNALQRKYHEQGLDVLSVVLESGSLKNIREKAAKYEIEYPVLIGTDRIQNRYKIVGFPTTFLMGWPWRIHKKYAGLRSSKEAIESDIQALLSAASSNPSEVPVEIIGYRR